MKIKISKSYLLIYRRLTSILLSLIMLISSIPLTFAQRGEEELLFQEIPVVVLPTRLPQPITKAPAAISVVTAEDIAHSGYINIWDLLRSQPGVDVFQMSGNMAAAGTRGFNDSFSEKLQVLVDGRTIFDPLINSVFWKDHPILLEDIERIEIMRGPNSVLFGFNAFNGIINIVTKDPKDTKGILTKVTFGDHSTQQYYGRVGDRIGKLDYRLSYMRDNSRGLGDNNGKEIIDGKRMNIVSWRSCYTISEDKNLEFLTGVKTGNEGNAEDLADARNYHRTDFQQLKYNQVLSPDSSFFIQFFRNYMNRNLDNNPNQHEVNYKQYDLEFQYSFKPLQGHNLVWGGNWRRNECRLFYLANPFYFYHDTILRIFGQDAITITDKLTYYCGLEWAQNNLTQTDWSTRQTAMYNLFDDHYLRATYGRAYHASGFVNYYFYIFPIAIGNPDLERTSIDAYELGYRGSLLDRKILFDLEFFYNNIDNIREEVGSTFDNSNQAEARGVETSLEYMPFRWLKTYLNHTYLSVDDKGEEYKEAGPKHKVNVGTRIYMKEKYLPDYIDMKFYYVGGISVEDPWTGLLTEVPHYYKLDIKMAKRFFKDKMEVGLTGLNLLKPRHFEYGNRIKVDRRILVSVRMEF